MIKNLLTNKFVLYTLLSLSVLFGVYVWHTNAIECAVLMKSMEYEKIIQEQAIKAKDLESKLKQDSLDQLAKKEDELKDINIKLDAAIERLRDRNSRKDAGTKPSKNPGTCTGTELYREDAEFLTREASRAESILVERDYYYQQYENARRSIEQFNSDNK